MATCRADRGSCSDDFPGRELVESLREFPYVIADRVTGNPNADTVSIDNEDAGAIGARRLIDLGHRDILIASSSLSLENIRQRCSGASQVLRSRGLPEPAIVELGAMAEEAPAGSRIGSIEIRGRLQFRR